MNVLIVDDEQPARDRLRTIIDDAGDWTVVGEARNGQEALQCCSDLSPDVVLLDIRMPGIDGIETANHLNQLDNPPAVVFTTAYDEYAIDAFEARAVGYVLKPVRRAKLVAALSQAARIAPGTLTRVATDARMSHPRGHICTRTHDQLHLIPVADIVAFIADQKYVSVHHAEGQHLINESLKALATEFADAFVRIHRSTLVAVAAIERIKKTEAGTSRVVLRQDSQLSDKELIISRRHLPAVRRRLKNI